jgi:hypothetical protein
MLQVAQLRQSASLHPTRAVLALATAATLCAVILLSFQWATRDNIARDFGSFWASGDAANRGDDPYGVYERTFRVGSPEGPPAPNLNPPVSVYPFQLLARLEISLGLKLWRYGSLAVYGVAVAALLVAYPDRRRPLFVLWPLGLAGLWHTLELGQVYVPLMALAVAGWLGLKSERRLVAGLAIGALVAIKPNFALWPLLLFAAGERKAAVAALTTAAGLSLLPLLHHGPTVYLQWLAVTPSLADTAGGMAQIGGNFSLVAIFGRLGMAPAGVLLSVALLGAALAAARDRPRDVETVSSLALVSSLLVGPVTWTGYGILLLPVFFAVRWTWPVVASAALLCVPFFFVIEAGGRGEFARVLAESVYGAAAILLVFSLLLPRFARRRATRQVLLPRVSQSQPAP